MKYIIITFLSLAIYLSRSYASEEDIRTLTDKIESAVRVIASGNIEDGVHALEREGGMPKGPKEINAQIDAVKSAYKSLDSVGAFSDLEKLSSVAVGSSIVRLRFIEKRENGAIIWTFIEYRLRDRWFCKNVGFIGKENILELIKDNLDGADFKAIAE